MPPAGLNRRLADEAHGRGGGANDVEQRVHRQAGLRVRRRDGPPQCGVGLTSCGRSRWEHGSSFGAKQMGFAEKSDGRETMITPAHIGSAHFVYCRLRSEWKSKRDLWFAALVLFACTSEIAVAGPFVMATLVLQSWSYPVTQWLKTGTLASMPKNTSPPKRSIYVFRVQPVT